MVNQPTNSYLIRTTATSVSNVRYIAAPDVPVNRESFRAVVDLKNAKVSESEDSLIRVQLVAQDPRIQIIDFQPQQVTVALDPIVNKQVSVQVDLGTVPSGLSPGSPTLSATTVDVKGAASIVRRVAYADARVRIDASGLDVNQDVDLVAHDATDAVVDNVQFTPLTVHVAMLVGSKLRTETVPVNPVVVGTPAPGYYVSSVDVNPLVVAVRGQADALALLKGPAATQSMANTQAISISGATADVSTTVDLNLPAGVTSDGATKVAVVVHLLSPGSTRSVSIGVVPDGARSDRVYSFSTPSVTVTLGGATAALNAFDTSTLVASVSVVGLDVGTSTVTITVNLPPGIKLVAISPSQIVVTVTNAPSPPPKASASP
jgi:YbbR domain-containing protein